MIKVYTDGASSGNPGKVGIGYTIYKDDECIKTGSFYLGIQTNNFAEYMALIFALVDVLGLGYKRCRTFSDSQLLCEQINGNYQVKNKNIFPLFVLANSLIAQFDSFIINHIPREENTEADKLSKDAAKSN